jgi:hypothetical protein
MVLQVRRRVLNAMEEIMWHRAMINKFLNDRKVKVPPKKVKAIEERLAKVPHQDGNFVDASLAGVFEDADLEAAFRAAWEADPVPFIAAKMIDSNVTLG